MSLVRPAKEVLGRGWANFGELREGEVRRMLLPRTPVNKGKEKGRGH